METFLHGCSVKWPLNVASVVSLPDQCISLPVDAQIMFCVISERNLNPKAACLKRREEEKSEEQQAGRSMVVPPHDIGHQLALVRFLLCLCII